MTGRPDLQRFKRIDDRLSLLIIAADYLSVFVIAAVAIAARHPLATAAAILLIAGRQVAFLNLVHAAGHGSLFSTRRRNDHADPLVGYPIFDAVVPYRSYHLEHHADFAVKSANRFDYLLDDLPGPYASAWRRAWVIAIKPLLGSAGLDFVQVTLSTYREHPRLAATTLAYWLVIVGVFAWTGWLPYLLVYWFLPLLWLYPVLYSWAEITDHYAVRNEARNQAGLFYALFIKGHEMYHAVHHLYPGIPFYRIKAASRYLRSLGEDIEESRGLRDFVGILSRHKPSVPGAAAPAERTTTSLGTTPASGTSCGAPFRST